MIGTFAISGSVATRFKNVVIAFWPSIRSASMFTSIRFAPFSTWSRATSPPAWKSPDSISRAKRFDPVMLVRSPTITNPVSGVMRNGSRPLNDVNVSVRGIARGSTPRTVSAIWRMCSGVVPQHPPTRFTRPARANSPRSELVISGVSSKPPKALGSPAFG